MSCLPLFTAPDAPAPQGDDRYSRLRRTRTFRAAGMDRWFKASLVIIGAGVLGWRVALEAVRSGVGRIWVYDFGVGRIEHQANQLARPGVRKVDAVVAACAELRPGVAHGFHHDIRHAGMQRWLQSDVVLDCTDDPGLAWPLTESSNGVSVPLLRCAVDGSGQFEIGRVLCSDGGGASACQLCSYSVSDLHRALPRTPCLDHTPERAPTLAGGPIASAIAALGVLQAQRLVTGNDVDHVLDRELILDFSNHRLLEIQLNRCPQCLSGHRRWGDLTSLDCAHHATLAAVFQRAEHDLQSSEVKLSAYQHPLNTQACCECGSLRRVVGSDWATPPECDHCGRSMTWLRAAQMGCFSRDTADRLAFLHTSFEQLGLPHDGVLLVARAAGHQRQRYLLRADRLDSCGSDTAEDIHVPPSEPSAAAPCEWK